MVGPIAGGFLSQAAGWRWTFWVLSITVGQPFYSPILQLFNPPILEFFNPSIPLFFYPPILQVFNSLVLLSSYS